MEVMKDVPFNPIMQDESNGMPRYYTYGVPFFNYGLIPQTWEDPHLKVSTPQVETVALGGEGRSTIRLNSQPPLSAARFNVRIAFDVIEHAAKGMSNRRIGEKQVGHRKDSRRAW